MHWNFGRWVAGVSATWPGVVAWLVKLLHRFGEQGPPWNQLGG